MELGNFVNKTKATVNATEPISKLVLSVRSPEMIFSKAAILVTAQILSNSGATIDIFEDIPLPNLLTYSAFQQGAHDVTFVQGNGGNIPDLFDHTLFIDLTKEGDIPLALGETLRISFDDFGAQDSYTIEGRKYGVNDATVLNLVQRGLQIGPKNESFNISETYALVLPLAGLRKLQLTLNNGVVIEHTPLGLKAESMITDTGFASHAGGLPDIPSASLNLIRAHNNGYITLMVPYAVSAQFFTDGVGYQFTQVSIIKR